MRRGSGVKSGVVMPGGAERPGFSTSNQLKAARKRIVLLGFPKDIKFRTKEEIDNYFTGDRIQCLLCGRWFKGLAHHVAKIHNVDRDEYKERFGLPYSRGLSSEEFHNRCSRIHKKLFSLGINPLADIQQRLKGVRASVKAAGSRKPDQPFNTLRKGDTHKHSSNAMFVLPKSKCIAVLREAKMLGRNIHNVCGGPGMPSRTSFYKWAGRYELIKPRKED